MHSLRGNIDEAVIMTSDLDFFPLFEALLQTKTTTRLLYQPSRTSSDLIGAADLAIPLDVQIFLSWADDARHLQQHFTHQDKDISSYRTVKTGHCGDQQVVLMQHPEQKFFVCVKSGKGIGPGRRLRCLAEHQFEAITGERISYD